MAPKGKLYTTNPAGLKKITFDANVLLITRAGVDIPGTEVIRELSPSPELFRKFLNSWKDRPGNEWWSKYEEKFNIEMKSNIKINALRDVYKRLLIGKNVVLVCFCKDHRYCHRKLVGDFFEQYGVKAIELNPIIVEQITFF